MNYLLQGQETARLKFSALDQSYYDAWLPIFQQRHVARFVGLEHLETPQEQCNTWFERAFTRISNGLGGLNALVHKQTNELVGQCGLLVQVVDDETRLEVGYSILPQYWKQGYATEAAIRCRDYAFKNELTDSLISIIHIENNPSMKVAEANGMQLWKNTLYKGSPVNIFRITKEEWENIRKAGA